jgi:hypothetical protein
MSVSYTLIHLRRALELWWLMPSRCCTMVGLVENALEEIKEKMNPDRIIIESRYVHHPPRPGWIPRDFLMG